jgi:HK97 gp10 family phage protein
MAAMKMEMRVEGLQQLDRALRELPRRFARRSLRRALAAGAKIIRDTARQLAPVDSGYLRKQIILYRPRNKQGYAELFEIGVRLKGTKAANAKRLRHGGRQPDPRASRWPAYYWRFIEFGTSKMPARPFLRTAFESRQSEVVAAITNTLREELAAAEQELSR